MKRLGMIGAAAMLLAGTAAAHEPYLLPNLFGVAERDHVTVQASFTEDLFIPDIVMKAGDWQVIGPDGAKTALTATYFKDLAVLEAPTPVEGTYRISTGLRTGRIAKAALVNGEWTFLEDGKPAPAGSTAVDMQSFTLAETYVTRGKPSDPALAPRGTGLEILAITHPSSIIAGQDAVFELLADGKPVAGQAIELTAGDKRYGAPALPAAKTGADGRFTFKAPKADVYHAITRYRIGPAAPGQPHRSFTYALTFEADD